MLLFSIYQYIKNSLLFANSVIADIPNECFAIGAGLLTTADELRKGIAEIEVLVPNVLRKDSIVVSEDSRIPINLCFVGSMICPVCNIN